MNYWTGTGPRTEGWEPLTISSGFSDVVIDFFFLPKNQLNDELRPEGDGKI